MKTSAAMKNRDMLKVRKKGIKSKLKDMEQITQESSNIEIGKFTKLA